MSMFVSMCLSPPTLHANLYCMSPPPVSLQVRVLGTVAVLVDGEEIDLSPVERNLVALFAAGRDAGLDAERLADQLWPDRLPATWKSSLRNSISRLNKKVAHANAGGERLVSEPTPNRRLLLEPDAVDLWRLETWALDSPAIGVDELWEDHTLLTGQPFVGCELSSMLRDADVLVGAARQDIVDGWVKEREQLSHRLLTVLRQLCLNDPYNEPLAESVAELHLAAGQHRQLAELLDQLQEEMPLSEALAEVAETLDDQRRPTTIGVMAQRANFPLRSPIIDQLAAKPLIGRDELLTDLLEAADGAGGGVVINGPTGIGKTRLAAEVAHRLAGAGHHTAYVVADQSAFGSLQPFIDAFANLSDHIRPFLGELHDMHVQAQCRQVVIDHLASTFAGRPLCLVVDDVHWLDDQSSALLMALCRNRFDLELFVIALGRSGEQDARWPGWQNELGRAGLASVAVPPLDRDAVLAMIHANVGELERLGAIRLADELLDLSAGLPDVAVRLMDRVDPVQLQVRTDEVVGTGYASVIGGLADQDQHCGSVAAVLGRQFNLEDLVELLDQPYEQVDDSVRRLEAADVVDERPIPGEFRFVHVLMAEACQALLTPQELTRHHARAFELHNDPLRRAHHAELAAPAIGPPVAAQALLTAARLHFTEGSYQATADSIQRAADLDPGSVSLSDRVMRVEALELGGVRAMEEIGAVVTEAIGVGDMSRAFEAAVAGLPQAEALEGDPGRVRTLLRIDPTALSVDEQVIFHRLLSRQLVLLGRVDEATEHADQAARVAVSPDQRALAWVAQRLADGTGIGRPLGADVEWPPLEEIQSDQMRLRISQARVINHVATGGSRRHLEEIRAHAEMLTGSRYPHQEWLAQVVLVTALTDLGEHQEAVERAGRAHQFGLRSDLRVAAVAYEAQLLAWELHRRRHGALYPMLAAADDISNNIVLEAALVGCQWEATTDPEERAEIAARAGPLCRRAINSAFDVACIGVMADAIAATGDAELMAEAAACLDSRRGAYVMVASAAANLGPCSRLLAKLQPDQRQATALREQALAQADDDRLPLWQIIGRLELADDPTVDQARARTLLDEANGLAATPWLQDLLTSWPRPGA